MATVIHGKSHESVKFFREHPAALAVYWIYCSRVNYEQVAWPSLACLVRDTGWSRTPIHEARQWLIKHGALEVVENYVKPEWRKFTDKTIKKKTGLDRTLYLRPTGKLTVDEQEYPMLYIPQNEKTDAETHEDNVESTSDRPSNSNDSLQRIPELDTSKEELDTNKELFASPDGNAQSVLETDAALYGETVIEAEALMPVEKPKKERPPNLWYDAIAATLGVEGWKNGHIQNVLLGTGKNGYSRYNLHTPLTEPEQVHIFWAWFEKKCKGCELKSVATTQSRVMEWQREGMPDVRNEVKPKSQTDIAMERLAQGLPYVFG